MFHGYSSEALKVTSYLISKSTECIFNYNHNLKLILLGPVLTYDSLQVIESHIILLWIVKETIQNPTGYIKEGDPVVGVEEEINLFPYRPSTFRFTVMLLNINVIGIGLELQSKSLAVWY